MGEWSAATRIVPALVLVAGTLAGCEKQAPSPEAAVQGFYALRLKLAITGAPAPKELAQLAPFLGEELRDLLAQARKRHDDDVARTPADKPSFSEGELFSSLFEGPTSFEVGADEATGDVHRISVQLAYDLHRPVTSWTDKVVVKAEAGKWVVTDIEYGGSWAFGNKGSLVSALKKALAPEIAARILGDWTIAGHRIAGTGAMGNAQAQALHGQALRYEAEAATSGKDVCPHASYKTRGETAGPYLSTGFRAEPQALGMRPDTLLEITEVSCGGVQWGTLGGVLVISPAGRTFAPWNGVFFEVKRRE